MQNILALHGNCGWSNPQINYVMAAKRADLGKQRMY